MSFKMDKKRIKAIAAAMLVWLAGLIAYLIFGI